MSFFGKKKKEKKKMNIEDVACVVDAFAALISLILVFSAWRYVLRSKMMQPWSKFSGSLLPPHEHVAVVFGACLLAAIRPFSCVSSLSLTVMLWVIRQMEMRRDNLHALVMHGLPALGFIAMIVYGTRFLQQHRRFAMIR